MQGRLVFSAEFGQTGLRAGTVNQYLRTLSHTQHCGPGVGLAEANPLHWVQYLQEPRGRVRFVTGQALDVMRAHAKIIRLDTPLVLIG